jgi:hypothetical protein
VLPIYVRAELILVAVSKAIGVVLPNIFYGIKELDEL